jgi:hypothetical protein
MFRKNTEFAKMSCIQVYLIELTATYTTKRIHTPFTITGTGTMMSYISLSNEADAFKKITIGHMLSMQDCTCTTTEGDTDCTKYSVEVDYLPLCEALGFDSSKKLYIADTHENIPVVDPVPEDQRKAFDHPVRVVRIPMHKCTPETLNLTQTV